MIDVNQAKRIKELFVGDPRKNGRCLSRSVVSDGHSVKWQRDLWPEASVRCVQRADTFTCTVAPMCNGRSIRMAG